jgi:hypothetical protein
VTAGCGPLWPVAVCLGLALLAFVLMLGDRRVKP